MAIKPKELYPGQTESSDPGYPWGKARNVNTPGDGSGTPWEKLVANDLFGWQQALLSAAGVIPSGSPDKLGASDYLNAMQVLIENGLVALTGRENLWSDDNYFTGTLHALGLTNLNTVNLNPASEINYTVPKTRKIIMPPVTFVPGTPSTSDWTLIYGIFGWAWSIASASGDPLYGSMRLPAGCSVSEVKAWMSSGAGSDLGMQVGRQSFDTTTPTATATYTMIGAAPVQAAGTFGVLSTGPVAVPFAESDLLVVRVDAGTIVNVSQVYWVEVTYTETRATGSQ